MLAMSGALGAPTPDSPGRLSYRCRRTFPRSRGNRNNTMNFLAEIVARKLEDSLRLFEPGVTEAFKAEIARRPAPVSLKAALDGANGPAIIAEVKRASPSKGEFAMHWDPVALAQIYQNHGAAAISVLTETHYFKGDPEFIRRMRPLIHLPILRKSPSRFMRPQRWGPTPCCSSSACWSWGSSGPCCS